MFAVTAENCLVLALSSCDTAEGREIPNRVLCVWFVAKIGTCIVEVDRTSSERASAGLIRRGVRVRALSVKTLKTQPTCAARLITYRRARYDDANPANELSASLSLSLSR